MATAAAAVGAKARKDVAAHFMGANAVSPDSAVPFDMDRPLQRRMFDRMVRSGVLVEAKPGRWYMHMPAYAEDQGRRRRTAGIAIAASAVIAAAAAMLA